MYHAPRGKGFFLLGLFSIFGPGKEGFSVKGLFWEEKKKDFRVQLDVSLPKQTDLPRRTSVCLGEGGNLPMEDWFYV